MQICVVVNRHVYFWHIISVYNQYKSNVSITQIITWYLKVVCFFHSTVTRHVNETAFGAKEFQTQVTLMQMIR